MSSRSRSSSRRAQPPSSRRLVKPERHQLGRVHRLFSFGTRVSAIHRSISVASKRTKCPIYRNGMRHSKTSRRMKRSVTANRSATPATSGSAARAGAAAPPAVEVLVPSNGSPRGPRGESSWPQSQDRSWWTAHSGRQPLSPDRAPKKSPTFPVPRTLPADGEGVGGLERAAGVNALSAHAASRRSRTRWPGVIPVVSGHSLNGDTGRDGGRSGSR